VASGELESLSRERFWAEMEKTLKQTKRLDRFFSVLDIFGVMDGVTFFKDVFGSPWCTRQSFLIPSIVVNLDSFYIPEELKLPAFVALVANANAEQTSQVIPAKAKKLTQAIRMLRSMNVNAVELLGFFKSQRAFTEGNLMQDIINIARLGEHVGIKFPINPINLGRAWMGAGAVTGVNYQHLSGKDLGAAIEEARLEAIDMSLHYGPAFS